MPPVFAPAIDHLGALTRENLTVRDTGGMRH